MGTPPWCPAMTCCNWKPWLILVDSKMKFWPKWTPLSSLWYRRRRRWFGSSAWFAAGMDDQVQMCTFETIDSKFKSRGATPKWHRLYSADPWPCALNLRAGGPPTKVKVQAFLDEGSDEAGYSAPTAPVSAGYPPTVGVPSAVGASHQWCPDRTIFWLRPSAFG